MSGTTRQKGAASSTPSSLRRWALSRYMTHVISERHERRTRKAAEARRRKEGRRHVVEYFHQVDDGFSHLALQLLTPLAETYDVDLVAHLVPALRDDNFPEPDLAQEMSRRDAAAIAPCRGLGFPPIGAVPPGRMSRLAAAVLAGLDVGGFARVGPRVSESLWCGDEAALRALGEAHGVASDREVDARLREGAERRAKLRHYNGAMFHYEREWYWGVDRLHHLETRLRSLGAVRADDGGPIAPVPRIGATYPSAAREMTLEYYPSLRSPYTAVSWAPTMKLARDSGVALVVRPIVPMVIRGVPATFDKAFYAFKDAAREARALGVDYGDFHDPVGDPVERGCSLYAWAESQGKGLDFFGAFLNAAFVKGRSTNSPAGMRRVVEAAGLDWAAAERRQRDDGWREVFEANRRAMYGFGSWGVPSYRLLDRDGNAALGVWGQDRLWLVARKIEELAA